MMPFLLLLSLGSSWAGEVGDPISNPRSGRVAVDVGYGVSRLLETDGICEKGNCDARTDRRTLGLNLGVSIVRGAGLYGFVRWIDDSIPEARFKMDGQLYGGGLKLAWPLKRSLWLAADSQVGAGEGGSVGAPDLGTDALVEASTTVMAVFGHPEDGGHAWVGVQYPWMYRHDVQVTERLKVPLQPRIPVSAVVGATFISDKLGTPWGNSPQLRGTIEARVGQENAVSVSTGLGF